MPTEHEPVENDTSARSPLLVGIGAALGVASLVAGAFMLRRQPRPAAQTRKRGPHLAPERGAYTVSYFARKYGISAAEARSILAEASGDRAKANAIARYRQV